MYGGAHNTSYFAVYFFFFVGFNHRWSKPPIEKRAFGDIGLDPGRFFKVKYAPGPYLESTLLQELVFPGACLLYVPDYAF